MIYLLDTHYVLWSLFEPEKITDSVRQILENDTDTNNIVLTAFDFYWVNK